MKILSLSEDLRNKISAGEVVERPASVVKELLENSLDAGAANIEIVVENGGHQLIQVTDDGHGMSAEELPAAFERYCTSKIHTVDDLFNIGTLGFRGEALASIASVSEIKIISSTGRSEGASLKLVGGEKMESQPAPAEKGTQITVNNLFYNTPARRKFLKSAQVELRQIVQTVRCIALAYPEVGFVLVADNKELINVQKENQEDRIAALFDPTYRKNILPVSIVKGDYIITGFVGNLNLIRSRPGEQFIFLNRRFIKDRLLNSAVYSGYQALTKRGEYPFFVINLVIPPEQVDVNVHPMKTEVRFRDEWRIYHVLKSGVTESLADVLSTVPFLEKPLPESKTSTPRFSSVHPTHQEKPQSDLNFQQRLQPTVKTVPGLERAKSYASSLAANRETPQSVDTENIWQIHNKYIVSQINSGLVIIDQHVAHERVLFEEALAAFESSPMPSQTLLFPESLTFSPDEYSVLLDILPYLEKIGFRMKESAVNSVTIDGIPSAVSWGNERKVIRDIIDHYLNHQKEYSSFQENIAASFACHAAIKAGDSLTMEEMQVLVNRLFGTKHPYYCPHGRPIIIQLTLDELDKRFERT